MKIGIVIGSIRKKRKGEAVGKWVYDYALNRNDHNVEYELIDLKDYKLPFFDTEYTGEDEAIIKSWKEKMASLDGYIFVTPEFNRLVPGGFKNALEFLTSEVYDKACAYVSYGGLGGLSAIQSLRLVNAEQQMASVRTMLTFSIMSDFDESGNFIPASYHDKNINQMLDQLIKWSKAMKTIR